MAFSLENLFVYWESIGVFDILLPFFLIFAVSYSLLQTTKILKDKKINTIIAAIIGILFVQNQYLVGVLNSFIPNISMTLIVILMLLLVAGIFMGEKRSATGAYGVAAVIAIVFVLWALNAQTGGYALGMYDYFDAQTTNTIILVGIFVFVIYFVTKNPSTGRGWDTFSEGFGKLFGRNGPGGDT